MNGNGVRRSTTRTNEYYPMISRVYGKAWNAVKLNYIQIIPSQRRPFMATSYRKPRTLRTKPRRDSIGSTMEIETADRTATDRTDDVVATLEIKGADIQDLDLMEIA